MAYKKTEWKNRMVEKPRTFKAQNNEDGTITLIPMEGTIVEPGTPINAENMNNIENGIENLEKEKAPKSIYGEDGKLGTDILTALSWSVYRDNVYKCIILRNLITKMSLALYDNGIIHYNGKPLIQLNDNSLISGGTWALFRSDNDKYVGIFNKTTDKYFKLFDDGTITYGAKKVPVVQLPSFDSTVRITKGTEIAIAHNLGYLPLTEVSSPTTGNVIITWTHVDNNNIKVFNYSNYDATVRVRCW